MLELVVALDLDDEDGEEVLTDLQDQACTFQLVGWANLRLEVNLGMASRMKDVVVLLTAVDLVGKVCAG